MKKPLFVVNFALLICLFGSLILSAESYAAARTEKTSVSPTALHSEAAPHSERLPLCPNTSTHPI